MAQEDLRPGAPDGETLSDLLLHPLALSLALVRLSPGSYSLSHIRQWNRGQKITAVPHIWLMCDSRPGPVLCGLQWSLKLRPCRL